jgi:hypothetical protein
MGQASNVTRAAPGAGNAQAALLGVASLVVVAVVVALVAAGVTSGEIAATVLFLPVFAAGLLGGRTSGYVAAVVATLLFVAIRRADMADAGLASSGALILARAAAYAVAGHAGAAAQSWLPSGASAAGAGNPALVPVGRAAPRRATAAGPPPRVAGRRTEQRAPVLVGAAPGSGPVPYGAGYPDSYGPDTMTMSGGWPPPAEPSREASQEGWYDPDATQAHPGADSGGDWSDGGWAAGPGGGSVSPPSGELPSAADDSWDAVQRAWRHQHGVPEDERPDEHDPSANGGWPPAQGGWPAPAPAADPWAQPGPATGNGWGGPAESAWGDQAPPRRAEDAWGAPAEQAAPSPNGWDQGPATDAWGQPLVGTPDAWGDAPPTGGWNDAPAPSAGWTGAPAEAWGEAPPAGGWTDAAPAGTWSGAPAADDWSEQAAPGGWDGGGAAGSAGAIGATGGGWPATGSTGSTGAVWDDPAVVPAPAPPPPVPRGSALPAVDPETGLWTAKFLRDRLSSERHRSRRSGRPFSLVLVQVPDGPLAQLPYRRQVTLLRELGYQFVAGGVVDHLVHVPDESQHWFAVILPDTDRSGAQVLERRLRLGIGGYLSSRGLPLRELESAALSAPDDDPAMQGIWEALIGPDDGAPGSSAYDY